MQLTRDFTRIAASYAHIRSILSGLVPSVKFVGIITAMNPYGQQADSKFNGEANSRLNRDLRARGLGGIKINGKFMGNIEQPFLVPNIGRDLLIELCGEYRQHSVIYGEKIIGEDNKVAFKFEILDDRGIALAQPESIVLSTEEVYSRDDNYSYIGNEKPRPPKYPGQVSPTRKRFLIPFKFDD